MKRFPTPTEILSPQPISTINLIPTSTAFLPWSQAQPICWKGETSVSGWVTPWSGFQSQRIKRTSQRMGRVLWGILTATEMVNSLSGGIHGNLYIYISYIYYLYIYIYIDVCVCMWRGEASTALLPSYYSVASLHVLAFPNNSPSGRASVRKTSGSIVSIGNNLDVQDRSSAQIKVEVMNFARNSSESLTFGTWKWWFPNKNRLFQGKKIFRV